MTMKRARTLDEIRRRAFIALSALAVLITGAVLPATPAEASPVTPFRASFHGTFRLTFFTGEGGTHELFFHGRGTATHLGVTTVDGYSRLRPSTVDPRCNEIVDDEVRLTAANGSHLTVTDEALVTGSVPSGVTGTFDPLTFDGTFLPRTRP